MAIRNFETGADISHLDPALTQIDGQGEPGQGSAEVEVEDDGEMDRFWALLYQEPELEPWREPEGNATTEVDVEDKNARQTEFFATEFSVPELGLEALPEFESLLEPGSGSVVQAGQEVQAAQEDDLEGAQWEGLFF